MKNGFWELVERQRFFAAAIFASIRIGMLLIGMLVGQTARAATLNVPAQYATIQNAVDNAVNYDTVLVANGTYTGAGNRDIDFNGKELTVKSSGGPANCIIDCQQLGRAFTVHNGESAAASIEGFTIKNGRVIDNGGGIYVSGDSNPNIINAVVNKNSSTVSVQLNTGGAFGAKTDTAAGMGVIGIAAGDSNGDGRPDIFTANNTSSTTGVLLNQAIGGSTVIGVLTLSGIAANAAQNMTFQFRPISGGVTITKTQYVLPDGIFHFAGLPPNNYTVRAKGAKYLANVIGVNATVGIVTGVAVNLSGGDANGDNVADIGDFGIMVNAYNADRSVPGNAYDVRADFNGDGMIDIGDFGLLVNSYNNAGAP